jgi:hypothetical protein
MEAELASLAVSGANTLVGLMASDGWQAVRSRVAALFRHRDDVAGELEESRAELTAAAGTDDDVAADVEAAWRLRLRRLLRDDPAAAAALRELIAEYASDADRTVVHNTISGGDIRGSVIQTGTVNGGITFN